MVSEEDNPKSLRLPWAPSMIFGKREIRSSDSPKFAWLTARVAASATTLICSAVREVETGGADFSVILSFRNSLLELELERFD